MLRTRYRFQNEVKGISEMAYRIVSYVVFCKLKISKSDGGHAISRQEKRRLPKSTARFPAKKRGILHPPSGCLVTTLPLPQSLYGRAGVRWSRKISRIDRLPNLLSDGAPLVRCARGLRYNQEVMSEYGH